MSQSEIERFASDLKSKSALSDEVKGRSLADTVGIASRHGYGFTVEEAKTFLKAKAKAAGKDLSDDALDQISAGFHKCQIFAAAPVKSP
jgi:predicted ribosomally synthesized peptide with nif11-like leader